MYARRNESRGTILAPAKLNLFLEVLGRRQDGLHDVATLMVPIRLWDSLSMRVARPHGGREPGPVELSVEYTNADGLPKAEVPAGEANLVVRALRRLQARSGCGRAASMHLVKRIPPAAGLGGGSSDAAAALVLANKLWRLGWNRSRLAEVAAEIGSDVPFFLADGPAICSGRGEVVEGIKPLGPLHFVVVKPPAGLQTGDVYRALAGTSNTTLAECRTRVDRLIERARQGALASMGQWMTNGMESAAARLSPWIERLRDVFWKLDVVGHQMTGSGTAYFGLCWNGRQARRLAGWLRTQQIGSVYPVCSCP